MSDDLGELVIALFIVAVVLLVALSIGSTARSMKRIASALEVIAQQQ